MTCKHKRDAALRAPPPKITRQRVDSFATVRSLAEDSPMRMWQREGGGWVWTFQGNAPLCLEREGFEILDVEALRPHYARTLLHWAKRLEAQKDESIQENR